MQNDIFHIFSSNQVFSHRASTVNVCRHRYRRTREFRKKKYYDKDQKAMKIQTRCSTRCLEDFPHLKRRILLNLQNFITNIYYLLKNY